MTDLQQNPFVVSTRLASLNMNSDEMSGDEIERALDDLRSAKEAIETALSNLRNIKAARQADEIHRLRNLCDALQQR